MKKINWYIFIQIIKSCTLVFFIFISISWLLQISRLFSIMNNLQIEFNSILVLSSFLIPNLMNVTLPFIIIFGLILTFVKLDRDKEIIAIFSLGLSINQIKKPLILISILFIISYLFLNLFLSPYIYEKYKEREYKLRNIIDLNDINISNFIELDNNIILDFHKINNNFKDIFINFKEDGENIIFAKQGTIKNEKNNIIFNLSSGFKLNIFDNEIEKLEFENYKIKFPTNTNNEYNNIDKNTLTIFNLILQNDYKNIVEKIFDTLIVITLIIFFYFYNLRENKFLLSRVLKYLILSILVLIMHNIIKSINIEFKILFILNLINILFLYLYLILSKLKLNE